MKKLLPLLFLVSQILCHNSMAQSAFEVSEPRFQLKDNNILINYDILNSNPTDHFTVSVEVTDGQGNIINAIALSGDIGANVNGGYNKTITWDLEKDNISMDADIIVNIYARLVPPVTAELNVPSDLPESSNEHRTADENHTVGLMLQSIALPGLGMARVTGKPHWLRGAAGYGCIAGSIVLNRMAISNYDEFLAATTMENADSFMNSAKTQDNISEVLAYAAIGIWAADIVWSMLALRNRNGRISSVDRSDMMILSETDPHGYVPVIGFRMKL